MSITRRQGLILGASGLLGLTKFATASEMDGIGPNRGVLDKAWRGKQTCINTDVPVSAIDTRISQSQDFGESTCQMLEDSFEGPYFTCAPTPGKDITYGEPGMPLTVAIRLIDGNCQPIPGGVVDIWACNASGYYSGYGFSPDESPPMVRAIMFGHIEPDRAQRFCRGALRTDADGIAEFDTVYPGFYYSQPIHIHFKAHVSGKNLLTSQANFSEGINEQVMQTSPYSGPRPIKRSVKNTGFLKFKVQERGGRLLAVLDLAVPT
ncbi:intradiol ring-cleavage dioxygenase [Roseibium sp. TrichSKD4]|uniref:dioxygenase family protein n=1 Tax=Roseibium sp. TrichSKD4 TaxID=744980 RepID=UPI0001E57023|nr:intradiol ring-cleavage dioxygenase [Roseibium sp. TrichSKD4]EFO30450.1 intradiol ring-cleavage dioxygenase [Roseibium sp. TrichSKD4]